MYLDRAQYEDDVAVVRCHYLADAQQCFEASLGRSAMVATFRMWGAEFPGVSSSPVFMPASSSGDFQFQQPRSEIFHSDKCIWTSQLASLNGISKVDVVD